MIDLAALRCICKSLAVPMAVRSFPQGGDAAIRHVLRTCKRVFGVIDPSELKTPIVIFSQAQSDCAMVLSSRRKIVSFSELRVFVDSGFTLEIDSSTTALYACSGLPDLDIQEISTSAVVFWHHHGNEKFLIKENEIPLPRVFSGIQSIFALPYYENLSQALAYYRERIVQNSECEILKKIWFEPNRLFLKAKPESKIRDSLLKYLRYTLRFGAEVMPEQNVNETEPVDIRVTFQFSSNRVALIEIKWLGKSKHPDGAISAKFYAGRAIKGACQLAGYLDSYARSSSSIVKGYLVILDGRRYGLSANAKQVTRQRGMHYEQEEIRFPRAYHEERTDFSEPLRMFAVPICQ